MAKVVGSTFVADVCCNHVERSGRCWLRCECGAKCRRDTDGKIVEYSLVEERPRAETFD